MFQAQWFYSGTNTEGSLWDYAFFSNPTNENLIYNIEIQSDGEIKISSPYDPKIIDYTYDTSMTVGGKYVFGVIENPGSSNIKDVMLTLTFYDASDNIIKQIESSKYDSLSYIHVAPSVIEAGDTAVFLCRPSTIHYFDHYTVEIKSYEKTNLKTNYGYNGLIIKDDAIDIWDDYAGTRGNFDGTLKNTGSKVINWLRVGYTIYDSEGNIIYCWFETWDNYQLPIYSGQETSIYEVINRDWFEVYDISTQEDVSNYEIILDYSIE